MCNRSDSGCGSAGGGVDVWETSGCTLVTATARRCRIVQQEGGRTTDTCAAAARPQGTRGGLTDRATKEVVDSIWL